MWSARLVYGANDALSLLDSAPVVLSPGAETVLTWRLPDTGGEPIQSIGLVFHSDGATTDGAILLDYLRWDGPPDVELRRPDGPGEFWRRAWVNAVGVSTNFPQAFEVAGPRRRHDHPRRASMADYRVETALTVHLAEYAGVGVPLGCRACAGITPFCVRPDRLRLVRVVDGAVNVLAESAFAWTFETPYAFAVQVSGATIEASVSGRHSAQGARRKPDRSRERRGRVDPPRRRMLLRHDPRRPPRGALDPLGVAVSAAVQA